MHTYPAVMLAIHQRTVISGYKIAIEDIKEIELAINLLVKDGLKMQ